MSGGLCHYEVAANHQILPAAIGAGGSRGDSRGDLILRVGCCASLSLHPISVSHSLFPPGEGDVKTVK